MAILSIECGSISLCEFRIYLEDTGDQTDVRLPTRAVLYVGARRIIFEAVDNSLPDSTTAYDRVDDRVF